MATDNTSDGQPTNQTVIQTVVTTIAVNATIATAALGWCLINKIQPEAVLLTAFVGLAGTLFGYLGGMLSRTTPTSSSPTPTGTVTVPQQTLDTTQT